MKILDNCLIIGNRKFSVFDIGSYILSFYDYDPKRDEYLLFGEGESISVRIRVSSVEDYYNLWRLFEEYGFQVLAKENVTDLERLKEEYGERYFYSPVKLSSFKYSLHFGFNVLLFKKDVPKFFKTLGEISRKHSYRSIYTVQGCGKDAVYCVK